MLFRLWSWWHGTLTGARRFAFRYHVPRVEKRERRIVSSGRLIAMVCVGVLCVLGVATLFLVDTPAARPQQEISPKWESVAWPFPLDQWGRGLAFHCPQHACGRELQLFVRAKIGFCDCRNGVADDQEVDRVADVELISSDFRPAGSGQAIAVGAMAGRARTYVVETRAGRRMVRSYAFAANCNVAIATQTAAGGDPADADAERALIFLNGGTIVGWARSELGS